jgi:hypothetical protein
VRLSISTDGTIKTSVSAVLPVRLSGIRMGCSRRQVGLRRRYRPDVGHNPTGRFDSHPGEVALGGALDKKPA